MHKKNWIATGLVLLNTLICTFFYFKTQDKMYLGLVLVLIGMSALLFIDMKKKRN